MQCWQPTAAFENLKLRAEILAKIRAFFAEHGVLEVDTPLMSQATVTDLHLQSFATRYFQEDKKYFKYLYLQTSPEYAMKRLLAAGSGAIYQICKAFRNGGESGRFHNPEFTMMEWYRPDFDHHQLMDEMDELLRLVLHCESAERITYQDLFIRHTNIDPHRASIEELIDFTSPLVGEVDARSAAGEGKIFNRDDYLNLLMTHIIEPHLGKNNKPTFVYDFPATQAALAKIRREDPPVAERFEVYINGIELANGFHELTDAEEQRKRFIEDLAQREKAHYPAVPIDENLLAALQHGLSNCAGVALGIDRLIMLAAKTNQLSDVITFPLERA